MIKVPDYDMTSHACWDRLDNLLAGTAVVRADDDIKISLNRECSAEFELRAYGS